MATGPPLRYTIPPIIQTPIAIKSLPDGLCTIRFHDNEQTMKLYGDRDGIIRLHASSPKESEVLRKFVIDCDVRGNITRFHIELRVNSTPTSDMPSPPSDLPRPSTRTTTLPALSEKDMTSLSDKELIQRGYPLRPPKKALEAFNHWKKIVSNPITLIEPHRVVESGILHTPTKKILTGPGTGVSRIWSGAVIDQPPAPFEYVTGKWTVSTVTSATGREEASSTWVGIDGYGTPDVMQVT